MTVIDQLLGKKPQQRTISVCLDPAVGTTFAAARAAHQRAQHLSDEKPDDPGLAGAASDARAAYDEALDAVRDKLVHLTFQAIDPQALDELKSQHRPTSTQQTDARKRKDPDPEWNVDTFPPALIAASCILVEGPSEKQDGISVEDAVKLWSSPSYNESERAAIFNKALEAQLIVVQLGELPKVG